MNQVFVIFGRFAFFLKVLISLLDFLSLNEKNPECHKRLQKIPNSLKHAESSEISVQNPQLMR